MIDVEHIRALADALRRFPLVSYEFGDRILDCPEGVIENAYDGELPTGFTTETIGEFIPEYTALRFTLTNGVADEIGHDVANAILDSVHMPESEGS